VLRKISGPNRDEMICLGFEVLTTVVMKNIISWDITQCSPFKVSRHFGKNTSPPSSGSINPSKIPA
jgi:hypothetical protein